MHFVSFSVLFLNLWYSLYVIDFNSFSLIYVENIFFHLSLTITSFLVSFFPLWQLCFISFSKNLNFFLYIAILKLHKDAFTLGIESKILNIGNGGGI